MRRITQVERQLYSALNNTVEQNVLCVNLRLLLIHCFNIQNQSEKTAAYSRLVKWLYEKDQFFQRTFPACTYQTLLDITSSVDPVLAKPLIAAIFSNNQSYANHFLQQINSNKTDVDWYRNAFPVTQQFVYKQMISLLLERHQLMVTTAKSLLEQESKLNAEGLEYVDKALPHDCEVSINDSERHQKDLQKLGTVLTSKYYQNYQTVRQHINHLAGVHQEIDSLKKRGQQLEKRPAEDQKAKADDITSEIKEKHLASKNFSYNPNYGVIGDRRRSPNLFGPQELKASDSDESSCSMFSDGFYNGL